MSPYRDTQETRERVAEKLRREGLDKGKARVWAEQSVGRVHADLERREAGREPEGSRR